MSTSNSYMHTFPSWYPLLNMTQYASRYEVKSIQAWYKLNQIFTCENIRSSQRWNHTHIKPTWKYQTCKSTLEVIHARQHASKYTLIFIKQIKHASPKWKSYLTMQSNDEVNSPVQYTNASSNLWVYTSHACVSNWSTIHAPSMSVSQHAWTKQQTFGWAPMCTIHMVNN